MDKRIVLASKSPRRKELLGSIVEQFDIVISNKPEKTSKLIRKVNVPKMLAKHKAMEVYKTNKDAIVIGADTVVICNNQILGKPKDKEDARRMITMLSNNSHIVVTGVCIKAKNHLKCYKEITQVTFREMSLDEIESYCKLDTIYDKAGAYAIQAEAGKYITNVVGEYNNVVGLPTDRLKKELKKLTK